MLWHLTHALVLSLDDIPLNEWRNVFFKDSYMHDHAFAASRSIAGKQEDQVRSSEFDDSEIKQGVGACTRRIRFKNP